jgi:hypothetical protein
MQQLDEILMPLADGLDHDLSEVQCYVHLSQIAFSIAVDLLKEYGFIEVRGTKVRLTESMLNFLMEIENC